MPVLGGKAYPIAHGRPAKDPNEGTKAGVRSSNGSGFFCEQAHIRPVAGEGLAILLGQRTFLWRHGARPAIGQPGGSDVTAGGCGQDMFRLPHDANCDGYAQGTMTLWHDTVQAMINRGGAGNAR